TAAAGGLPSRTAPSAPPGPAFAAPAAPCSENCGTPSRRPARPARETASARSATPPAHRWRPAAGPARRPRPSCELVPPQPELLLGQLEKEPGVVDQVTAPEPARLVSQPEEPFQAGALHPGGGLGDGAAVEVEGGTDADQHRRGQSRSHPRHPELLLGRADPDPDDVGLGAIDQLDGVVAAELVDGLERRGVRAGDAQ